MAAFAGRDFRLKYDADGAGGGAAVVVAGARNDGMTVTQSAIEITDKDDAGIRTLLDAYGTWGVDLTCSGVLVGTQLSALVESNATTKLHTFEIEWDTLGTWRGSFFITEFETSGEDGDNPATFSCNLMSSGGVTFA